MNNIIRFASVPEGFMQELLSEAPQNFFYDGVNSRMMETYPDKNALEDFEPIEFATITASMNIGLSDCRRFAMDLGPDPYGYFYAPGGWIGTNEISLRWSSGFAPFHGHWVPIDVVRNKLAKN